MSLPTSTPTGLSVEQQGLHMAPSPCVSHDGKGAVCTESLRLWWPLALLNWTGNVTMAGAEEILRGTVSIVYPSLVAPHSGDNRGLSVVDRGHRMA
jgi:hypothetical protein